MSNLLLALKHMDKLYAFLKSEILEEVILTYSIAATFVAVMVINIWHQLLHQNVLFCPIFCQFKTQPANSCKLVHR